MLSNPRTDRSAAPAPTLVVMARPARPGHAKTRLIGDLTPRQAADVHQAMLDCVMARVRRHFHAARGWALVLAAGGPMPAPAHPWQPLDQGDGDLGERMTRIWRHLGGGPIVFLGVDSPDVPAGHYDALAAAIADAEVDVAVGPVEDGGYWTLAARGFAGELLDGIDWGTSDVYDQTRRRAADAGLRLVALPGWHDVDEPTDLADLRQRIVSATDPALIQLRTRLDAIRVEGQDATR